MSLSPAEFNQNRLVHEYPENYRKLRNEIITSTKDKRLEYRKILQDHLWRGSGYEPILLDDLNEVSFLLSSSRGGSSIAIDILKQQAMSFSGTGKKILGLPGEQKPYFELAQLTPPFKGYLHDELNGRDAHNLSKINILEAELLSEVGYPTTETEDIIGFAITIYGRLLLQWPGIDFGPADEAIIKIREAVKTASTVSLDSYLYTDDELSRENLLQAIKNHFPKIDLRFYDHLNNKVNHQENFSLLSYDCFIEEPPFIIPSPWHFATKPELDQSVLFLKDPSDAWRIPFWKEILKHQNITWWQLTRNVQESVNGLCDGWKFPFGYVTTRSPQPLNVRGYTDHLLPWTQWYANFSTSEAVWDLLLSGSSVDLEKIAVTQWADAHKSILQEVGAKISRLSFEELRSQPETAIGKICKKIGAELTTSLLAAARGIKEKRVQVTPGTDADSNRWRKAENFESILAYTTEADIVNLSRELGYNKTIDL